MTQEVLILAEGYQDRAFWAGCLIDYFRCKRAPNALPGHLQHRDGRGVYRYITSSGRYIHVYPCAQQPEEQGRNSISFMLADKLKERANKPFEHIVVNPT